MRRSSSAALPRTGALPRSGLSGEVVPALVLGGSVYLGYHLAGGGLLGVAVGVATPVVLILGLYVGASMWCQYTQGPGAQCT